MSRASRPYRSNKYAESIMESKEHKLRLLVVEDNLVNQFLLRYHLRDTFDLELVGRFDEALTAAVRQPFDLFLLDIDLGEPRTGVELLHALRQMPAYAATPAAACTANTLPGDRERLLASGFDAYVGKPFTKEGLLDTLHTVLASSRLSGHAEDDRQGMPVEAPPERQRLAA